MKKTFKTLSTLILAIMFFTSGNFIGSKYFTAEVSAQSSCDTTTCEWDYFGGWRCFTTDWYRTCNDSGYPDCFDLSCSQPGSSD